MWYAGEADRGGGELAARGPGVKRRAGVKSGPGAFLLLAVQPVKLAAEVIKVFALGGKPVDLFELDL